MDPAAWSPQHLMRTLSGSRAWPWLARAVTVALVIALGYRLADLTWVVAAPAETATVPTSSPSPTRTVASSQAPSGPQFAAWHLFGTPDSKEQAPAAPIDAPETQLNLDLKGVLHSDDPEEARAIVAGSGQPERKYRIGDELPGGATLERVYKDRVILKRNGRYETLKLPRDALEGADKRQAAQRDIGAAAAPLLEQLETDPLSVAQQYDIQPQTREGRIVGFQVEPKGRDPLYNRLDLRPNDIITAVNGIRLDNITNARKALRSIESGSRVTLTIERGGAEQTFTYNLGS